MVLNPPFQCPSKIFFDVSHVEAVASVINGRSWTLLTTAGWLDRGIDRNLIKIIGEPQAILTNSINPKIKEVLDLGNSLPKTDCIVAIGGGSTIDAAKGAVTLQALNGDEDLFIEHLYEGKPLSEEIEPADIIAVPTTAGTGSEVTRWGTIWGDDNVKYSVNHFKLYPIASILDPNLCFTMPHDVTLASGLDSLSHAMEAVWNHRHSLFTDEMAMTAIKLIWKSLPLSLEEPNNVEARKGMQMGSLIAGLAMSTTQTALAHSMSYPFTAYYGMPHGIACSFTLAEVAKYNSELDMSRLFPISSAINCQPESVPDEISKMLKRFNVGVIVSKHLSQNDVDNIADDLINRSRAANNIREADALAAKQIVHQAMDSLDC